MMRRKPKGTPKGWSPKMVALDIDGTLVDDLGNMLPSVRSAVRRVVEAGIPAVLATGRSWHGTQQVFDELELPPGPAVASNGAVIVEYPPFSVRRQVTFDPADVIEKVQRLAPNALIAVEDLGRGYRMTGPFPEGELSGDLVMSTAEELAAERVTRVIIREPGRSDQAFIELAQQLGLHGVSYFIGYSAWLDIAPEGVDKATALADIAGGWGIDAADVLALGDGRNDIEMLTWAGRGVAMGQAPAEVKAVADHVTDPFLDGGTAAELSRWF
ncbi:HAD family hydrolase [Propionibacteriaceae bacterium Y2011]|uniref:HAD family hydrolase n=1 Tax=Microlunatus sp. Y2014 TaxID=3418488 RepID=UPI003B4DC529